MNNFLNIMSISEKDMHRIVFVRGREEAGINAVYDPSSHAEIYQVFIHNRLPFRTVSAWEFPDFAAARSFAAKEFSKDWEFLSWDFKTRRPCEEGGKECGSGECDTCKSIKSEGSALGGGCSTESGKGSCGFA